MCVTFAVDCNCIYKEKVAGIGIKTSAAYLTTSVFMFGTSGATMCLNPLTSSLSTDLDDG